MRLPLGWSQRLRPTIGPGRWLRRLGLTKMRVAAATSVAAIVVLVGGWVLFGSGLFGVQRVEILGAERLDPGIVEATAGIELGTPLARVDTGAVRARLARLSALRTVDVHRRWPATVEIVVRERIPAAVQARGPRYALVDRSGVTFGSVRKRPHGLPLVSAPVDAGPPALEAALDVLESVPPSVRDQVRQVRAASAEQVTLRLSKQRTVLWGSPERAARKAAVLEVLLTRKATEYDVRAPDAPTTRR